MEITFAMIFVGCLAGCAYTSYKLGFREGTGKMIEFCASRRDKHGMTLMKFEGENIEFLDTLEYNKLVLDAISKVTKVDERA